MNTKMETKKTREKKEMGRKMKEGRNDGKHMRKNIKNGKKRDPLGRKKRKGT